MTEYKILKLKLYEQEIFIKQRKDMFCISLDTILLSNFVNLNKKMQSIIDFGTNNGGIAIFLAKKFNVKVLGIEIQAEGVKLAQENVKINELSNQVKVLQADIKQYASDNKNKLSKKVDAIVCNPPFFPLTTKTKTKTDLLKVSAFHEAHIKLEEIIESAAFLLKNKGKLFLIYCSERLEELFSVLKKNNFCIKRIQFVFPKLEKQSNVFLLEAVYKTNSGLIILPPLICHENNNSYASNIAACYNNGKISKD